MDDDEEFDEERAILLVRPSSLLRCAFSTVLLRTILPALSSCWWCTCGSLQSACLQTG